MQWAEQHGSFFAAAPHPRKTCLICSLLSCKVCILRLAVALLCLHGVGRIKAYLIPGKTNNACTLDNDRKEKKHQAIGSNDCPSSVALLQSIKSEIRSYRSASSTFEILLLYRAFLFRDNPLRIAFASLSLCLSVCLSGLSWKKGGVSQPSSLERWFACVSASTVRDMQFFIGDGKGDRKKHVYSNSFFGKRSDGSRWYDLYVKCHFLCTARSAPLPILKQTPDQRRRSGIYHIY